MFKYVIMMKTHLTLILFFFFSFSVYAQVSSSRIVFANTEIPNRFFKGDDSVVHYIKQHYRVCEGIPEPQTAVMSMVVEPDGSTSELEIISKINPILKQRIFEMFDTFPDWEPGIDRHKPVRSARMLLFKCSDGEIVLPPYKTPGG